MEVLTVRNARVHNLKNVTVSIPRNAMTVVCGVSGSGKSSLALDTIYAEGQRLYLESLSSYARQFLGLKTKPDVDEITGLSPTLSIEQKASGNNPRSTVGTITEIHDYLRVLFAAVGEASCYRCGEPIRAQTVDEMVDILLDYPEGTRLTLSAPVVTGARGEHRDVLQGIFREGFSRVRIDGTVYREGDTIRMARNRTHDIEIVVDRLSVRPGVAAHLTESLETCLKAGEGQVHVDVAPKHSQGGAAVQEERVILSRAAACTRCKISYPEISPRLFSFNSPQGACPDCSGLGVQSKLDPRLVVPNEELSLADGAVVAFQGNQHAPMNALLQAVCEKAKIPWTIPYRKLTDAQKEVVLRGHAGAMEYSVKKRSTGRKVRARRVYEGALTYLERLADSNPGMGLKTYLSKFYSDQTCETCKGARLRPEALSIRVAGHNIAELSSLPLAACLDLVGTLELSDRQWRIAGRVLREIRDRLGFLLDVGLPYLSLSRRGDTLSGGEAQRTRLATQVGSKLTGVVYVLDEPSIGLHQRDHERLLGSLRQLRDLGNTLIVVEHDEATLRAADHLIDIGPGAGTHGGTVVSFGPLEPFLQQDSLTARYLSGKESIPVPEERRRGNGRYLTLEGASCHNLRDIDVRFPLGTLTAVTGVSGSGKSSLVETTLARALGQRLSGTRDIPGPYSRLGGVKHVESLVTIDQSPIGRTPRSNPATYTGAWDGIRKVFSQTRDARTRGYGPGRFSFNKPGGRCEACEGNGTLSIPMHFLPDVVVDCEVCNGRRFSRETLEVRYRGRTIHDVLEMTVEEAATFFDAHQAIRHRLEILAAIGLSYIRLGQSATTLSGGEAQRLKLSLELSRRPRGHTVYFLDEPTTGLHFADVKLLLNVLGELVDRGHTVIVIEHNLDVIKQADHIIDLGPEGGDQGGRIVAEGTPEEVARHPASITGQYLRRVLKS